MLCSGGLLCCQSLLAPLALPLDHLLIKEWLDADTAGFRAEMPSKRVSTCKAPSTAPLAASLEVTLADKFLLS